MHWKARRFKRGRIFLTFELLDYEGFVETGVKNKVTAENFDINVQEEPKKYKWGMMLS